MNFFISKIKGSGDWAYQEQKMIIKGNSGMEYVNDINIIEAVIHVLDTNNEEPILNNYQIDLTDDVYKFLYKHMDKCFNDEELRYAIFKPEKRIIKDISQEFLNGLSTDIIEISQGIAKQLFYIMKANKNIPSCDLITASISTDQGPMLAILKMDYVKNFTHKVDFVDNKLGIGIVEQQAGLPSSGQKVQKCAFIRPVRENQEIDLMVIDKQKRTKEGEDFGAEYFTDYFLGCTIVPNERDLTKSFIKAAEAFTRTNINNDAAKAVEIREVIKNKLKQEEIINVNEMAREIFEDEPETQTDFNDYMESKGIEGDITVDKTFIEKKFRKLKFNADAEIDLNMYSEVYEDKDKFEIIKNSDGTVNVVIKNIKNFIEK